MTQTNAQRLADELEGSPYQEDAEAAAELRRLDAIERRHNEMLDNPCSEWDHKAYQQAIANLRAEHAQLRAQLEVAQAAAKAAVSKAEWQAATNTELNQLRAELEAVRRDAERYRWLRRQHEGDSSLSLCVFGPGRVYELEPIDSMPGELDAAIDSAQAERAKGDTP